MTEYTPTTEDIRYHWTFYEGDRSEAAEQFDRWFASEIAKAEYRGYEKGVTEASWGMLREEL